MVEIALATVNFLDKPAGRLDAELSRIVPARPLLVRFERRAEIHEGFLALAELPQMLATTHPDQPLKRTL